MLKGDSGIINKLVHVSAPYDCNEMVFVEHICPINGFWWRRVLIEEADPEKIIRCSKCEKPAVSMDHYWPFYSDNCLCSDHLK